MAFVPVTPGAELVNKIKPVLEEECRKLGLHIKAVESGSTSLKRRLTGSTLGQVGGAVFIGQHLSDILGGFLSNQNKTFLS